jgi:uncharacterized protein (TIGR03118 family)
MKPRIAANFFSFLIGGLLLAAASASAQTIHYRQTNLASDLAAPGFAHHRNPFLRNPWGIAFLPERPFFTASANNGHVIAQEAAGFPTAPAGFTVSNPAGTESGAPTGIVADPNSLFAGSDFVQPFVVASKDGGIYIWGPDANGDIPTAATLVVDHSQAGAVYTAVAILQPNCCAPFLAVANFHSAQVETYGTDFAPLGSFLDPSMPAGFAPYGMQVIGNQLFVASALQDAGKHDPAFRAGNGIVSIFDLEGHFLRRFATAGSLNAPWGITRAGADFGSFSNDILIGNVGDGTINAFDSTTGNFVGPIKDQGGNAIVNSGLHALAFRSDGFGNPNSLYFTAGINHEQNGLFGAITSGPGLSTTLILEAPANAAPDSTVTLTATLNSVGGIPTGQVVFSDGNTVVGAAPLDVTGVAVFKINTLVAGAHSLTASYSGDEKFGSSTSAQVSVTIASRDFSLSATPPTSTITVGQSAVFEVAIMAKGGFADPVTLSCSPMTGITCSFDPPMVTPNGGASTARLTVITFANLLGQTLSMAGPGFLLVGLTFASTTLMSPKKRTHRLYAEFPTAAASSLAAITLALTLASCGGYSMNGQANRRTASIVVTAQSGAISHTTTIRVTVK